jgi:hypothetical protein
MLSPEDDKFHKRTDDPFWNESAWFSFMIPEELIGGYVYFYHRPNMKLSAGGPGLFGLGGEEIHDCDYWDWNTCQPLPEGADMFDFTLRNGLTCETIDLQKSYRFTYAAQELELDLTWTCIMPPNELHSLEPGEVNPGLIGWMGAAESDEIRVGHYEQAGRMHGTVHLGERTFEVDCFSVRDHTWGPRTGAKYLRQGYGWAIASETSSFQAMSVSDLPASEDTILGTTERIVGGWFVKDGVKANLVSGRRQVVERGADGRPLREALEATDELGRTLNATGTIKTLFKWTGYNDCLDYWTLTEWDYDGQRALGEDHEFFTFQLNRQFQKALRARRHSEVGV